MSSTGSTSSGHGAWTEPGAYPVAPGITRIPLPLPMDGLHAVNVYVMETADGLVLIDGGWSIAESRAQFEASMKEAGYALSDIRQFLVTHLHRDHYTQAYVIGKEVGAPVSLGIGDKPSMDLMRNETHWLNPENDRLVLAGAAELVEVWKKLLPATAPVQDDYGMPDRWLEKDHTVDIGGRVINAVSTPGHTQGHYVFADAAAGVLFAGDHVLPTITPSIGFEPAWVRQPLRDYLDSLRKVRALPDLQLLPAHGPVTASSHARVDELLLHHEHRLDACLQAVAGGATTAWEVAAELPWTGKGRRLPELDPFNKTLAAFETLAHVDLLQLQGRLAVKEVDGVAYFSAVEKP